MSTTSSMSTNHYSSGQRKSSGKRSAVRGTTNVRYVTVTAMLSAIAFILMFLDFSVPIMPSFIQMDLSELPALIGSFALGPVCGVVVCLVKNLLHLMITSTGGVGELSNFVLGASFVLPAGLIYRKMKSKKGAVIGSLVGAVIMALVSFPSNFVPMDTIIAAYQLILPSADELWKCLLIFNVPFTFVKALFSVVITMLVYKKLSPILKGTQNL